MRLVRDTSLFHDDVVFEGSKSQPIPFDPSHTYTGTLEGTSTILFKLFDHSFLRGRLP